MKVERLGDSAFVCLSGERTSDKAWRRKKQAVREYKDLN